MQATPVPVRVRFDPTQSGVGAAEAVMTGVLLMVCVPLTAVEPAAPPDATVMLAVVKADTVRVLQGVAVAGKSAVIHK